MREMFGKIRETMTDVKTAFDIYFLARRYSRRNRDTASKSVLKAIYEKS